MKRFAWLLVGLVSVLAPRAAQAQAKLLISEVVFSPTQAEYVSITNRGTVAVDLTNYYLSDEGAAYYQVAGTPVAPGSSDFIARFPAGAIILPGETQYVSIAGAVCFETACGTTGAFAGFGVLPTYELLSSMATMSSALVPDMIVPFAGAIGATRGLTNGGEPIVLFYWDGATALVTDVDYVYGGAGTAANPGVNKTGVTNGGSTYANDTADSAARHAPLAPTGGTLMATCRVDFEETGMIATGGNGVGGRDETSESCSATFVACAMTTPGPMTLNDGGTPMSDAGTPMSDAGTPMADAGIDGGPVEVDAGMAGVDAGTELDAGDVDAGAGDVDAGDVDSGTIDIDAAIDIDGGDVDGGDVDASGSDAGAGTDAGPRVDAGTTRPPPRASGCGCRVGDSPSSTGGLTLAGLALAALVLRRRR